VREAEGMACRHHHVVHALPCTQCIRGVHFFSHLQSSKLVRFLELGGGVTAAVAPVAGVCTTA
jgi:hypothetical protein